MTVKEKIKTLKRSSHGFGCHTSSTVQHGKRTLPVGELASEVHHTKIYASIFLYCTFTITDYLSYCLSSTNTNLLTKNNEVMHYILLTVFGYGTCFNSAVRGGRVLLLGDVANLIRKDPRNEVT